jgi:hypothetical protein
MGKTFVNQFFKKLKEKEKWVNISEQDLELGIKHFWCSAFIESENLLIKGEYNNQKISERNALLILTDPKTGKIKGSMSPQK